MKRLMRKSLIILFSMTLLCAFSNAAVAVENPVNLIQDTVGTLQVKIKADQASLSQSPQKLFALVRQIVMPHVAIDQMAGLVLGPKWRTATAQQRQEFIDQFGLLLTRTYANALLTASDYNVQVYPMRGVQWKTAQYIAVKGAVTSKSNGSTSQVTYYLERSGNTWKIYDMAVEGVSFMQNFRSQFQSFSDMDSLLKRVDELNAQSV